VNGQILGWDPFEVDVAGDVAEIEVILTRRNTFGPLHDRLAPRDWTGPQHFVTEGAEFSPEPIIYPSGLLNILALK
jgi:hypothetical protein